MSPGIFETWLGAFEDRLVRDWGSSRAKVLWGLLTTLLVWVRDRALNGAVYAVLRRLWRWGKDMVLSSRIGTLLRRHPREEAMYDGSLFCRLGDAFLAWMTRVARWIAWVLTFGRMDSWLLSRLRALRKKLPWLDLSGLAGLCVLGILLVPGNLWHNEAGLVLAMALFGLYLLSAGLGRREPLTVRVLGLPFLLFAFAAVMGVLAAYSRMQALRIFSFFLTAFLLYAALSGIIRDRKDLKKFLGCLYWAMLLMGVAAVCQRIVGVEADPSLTDLANNAGMPGRVFSTFENPNNYAEAIVLLLPLCLSYCFMVEERKPRGRLLAGLLIPLLALVMTYSRSSWVSFLLVVVLIVFLLDRRFLPALPVLGFLALPLLPASVLNRILTIGSTRDSSNAYRVHIWRSVLQLIRDHSVLGLGLGPENFKPWFLQYSIRWTRPATHAHMLYLEIWVEMGLLGIVSYLLFYFSTLRRAAVRMGRAAGPLRLVLVTGFAALGGISFVAAAEYIWYYPRVLLCYFILAGVLAAAVNIARREEAQ